MRLPAAWGALALLACAHAAQAKPIAFARGKTVMAEYGAGSMNEFQGFYAPAHWNSVGVGWTRFDTLDGGHRAYSYARANLLVHRWNLPNAQANVFAWAGLGNATGDVLPGGLARNAGFQIDYETRRVYAAFKSDLFKARGASDRVDTLQLGWAPYAHDYDTLATWIVVQGRRYDPSVFKGTEAALLVRLFKGGTWVEFGATTDGKPQAMVMFNF